ncbi:MAG: MFS transporter, partial [Candidatus Binatia bacterium]
WVGLAIMLALMIDAVVDPVIGHLSDHLHARWGRRHPFMYASTLPVAIVYWLLWNPPAHMAPAALLVFFLLVSVIVRLAISTYEIPSASLVPELTQHYDERTSLISYRYFFGWWGGLGMTVLAYAVFLQPDALHPVGVLNPEGYRHYGIVAAVVMLLAMLASAIGTHRFIPNLRQPAAKPFGFRGIFRELGETLSNRSFLALFSAGVFASMAAGLQAALQIYINTYFWELSSSQISVLVLISFASAVMAFVAAPILSRRFGKKCAAIGVSLAGVAIGPLPILLRLLHLFPANASTKLMPTLLVFNLVTTMLVIMSGILSSSMSADIVEDSELSTGRRSEGVFVAANEFVQKAVSGIGIFASTLLLAFIGFPSDAQPGAVDPLVVRKLGLVYAPALIVLYLVAIGFLATYSISRERHLSNLEKLTEKAGT